MITTIIAAIPAIGGISRETPQRAILIITNDDYSDLPNLSNTAEDAQLLEVKFEGLGFNVMTARNVSKWELLVTIEAFHQTYSNADIKGIYFAGHGM